MDRLKAGIQHFRKEVYPEQQELLQKLVVEGQKPHTLVIACSDSRAKVEDWTRAQPGEFFVVRNAGNVVPPWESVQHSGVTASIEYAIRVLNVQNVIVAGHSHCGAVSALFTPEILGELPAVRSWLDHAVESRTRAESAHAESSPAQKIRWAIGENVLLQIEHLSGYPCIQEKLNEGTLDIYAWVLELETGNAWEYDTKTAKWGVLE